MIFAIDPGTTQSGWVLFNGSGVVDCGVSGNHDVLRMIETGQGLVGPWPPTMLALEMVASYGMAVGREVFETVRWIGRFQQAWHDPEAVRLVYRMEVKQHLCHSAKAKDSNIRQALLDMFPGTGGGATPQVGTKAKPGPLYGMASHAWPALAVAVTAQARAA